MSGVRNSWLTLLKNAVFAVSSSPSFAFASRSDAFAADSSRLRRTTSRARSSPSSFACTSSVTSSTRCRMNSSSPDAESTGRFFGLQYLAVNVPSGPRMSYFCTAIVSASRVAITRSSDARRLLVPVASGSSGLSGNTSNRPLPSVSAVVCVASKRARVAATIVKRGASGSSTRSTSGDASNSSRKSRSRSAITGKR